MQFQNSVSLKIMSVEKKEMWMGFLYFACINHFFNGSVVFFVLVLNLSKHYFCWVIILFTVLKSACLLIPLRNLYIEITFLLNYWNSIAHTKEEKKKRRKIYDSFDCVAKSETIVDNKWSGELKMRTSSVRFCCCCCCRQKLYFINHN